MGAVVLALGARSPRFVALACISVVVAANAGGAKRSKCLVMSATVGIDRLSACATACR